MRIIENDKLRKFSKYQYKLSVLRNITLEKNSWEDGFYEGFRFAEEFIKFEEMELVIRLLKKEINDLKKNYVSSYIDFFDKINKSE